LKSPIAVFIALASLCGLIYWLSRLRVLAPVFRYIPPVLLVVFLPAASSASGLIPRSSSTYQVLRDVALPFGLFLMVVTTDVRAVLRVGPRALALMLCGSLGVMLGGIVSFAAFRSVLPAEGWKVMAAITGSWVGGGASFAAVQNAVRMPASMVGPAIVVDATVSYLWLACVLLAASYSHLLTRFYQPSTAFLTSDTEAGYAHSHVAREITHADLLIVLGLGLALATLCMRAGHAAFELASERLGLHHWLFLVLNEYALGILCVTLLGIALSFSPVRRIETMGSSALSYSAQFLFFASLGAQADFAAVLSTPLLLAAGVVMICVHIVILALGAFLIRAPLSLFAVCTIANLGGPSSAAVVGAQYGKAWASLGALLGIFGHLYGAVAGLLSAIVLVRLAG
jgi:uncharacterized membrane protein